MKENEDSMTHVNFSGLILGFSSAALYALGHSEVDGKKVSSVNVELAKQNIGIVTLLHEKTKGNLSPEEQRLIQDVLADLNSKLKTHSEKND